MSDVRSKDAAELAGISVRTLRHYHQIGLLPEPERSGNGYRSYGLADVALVMRIRRLASLGIALDRVPEFLDDHGAATASTADALLDELDQDLAARMDHLRHQREEIAALRESGRPPDLPPVLGVLAGLALPGDGPTGEFASLERDASLVVAQQVGDAGRPDLIRFGEAVAALDRFGSVAALVERFGALAPDAGDDQVEAAAAAYATLLGPAVTEFLRSTAGARLRRRPAMPVLGADTRLNLAQAAVLERVGELLEELADEAR